jgi:hypothetical protein
MEFGGLRLSSKGHSHSIATAKFPEALGCTRSTLPRAIRSMPAYTTSANFGSPRGCFKSSKSLFPPYTFNRMCSFLLAHLMIFSPGAKLHNWAEVLDGVPKQCMTLTGYQYNVSGHLMPVPRQYYNDRYIPPRNFMHENRETSETPAAQPGRRSAGEGQSHKASCLVRRSRRPQTRGYSAP